MGVKDRTSKKWTWHDRGGHIKAFEGIGRPKKRRDTTGITFDDNAISKDR